MKKLKWLFGLCLIMLVVCGSGMSVQAADVGTDSDTDVSNFRWKENDDGTVTITGYKGINETVIIPSEIDGKSVSTIGEKAFYERKDLKHVTIPEGVIVIKSYAFNACENLESVQLPNGLKIINMSAFSFCNFSHIDIPSTVEQIGTNAFAGCSRLEKIKIPNKVPILGTSAFLWCDNLTEVEFEDGIKNINFSSFELQRLLKVYIPDSVKNISGFLTDKKYNVTIYANPNSYARTYANQMGLKFACINDHDWDSGIVTTEATAIKDGQKTYTCTACKKTKTKKISKLGLPKKGKSITETKSNNTYKVTKSEAKNGTVELLNVNKSTSSVTIPDTVTVNGITYKVTSVSKNIFKNNKKLKKVTIGKNVKTIGANAFYGCKNLKTVTVKSTQLKTIGKNTFKGIHSKAKIKVPKSKLKSYKKIFAKKGQKSTVEIVK